MATLKRNTSNDFFIGDSQWKLELEEKFPEGISMPDLLAELGRHDISLTEATFRKYVQLGLLPRSVRVSRKGERGGSLGLYPLSTIEQVATIRRMLERGMTMQEIQRDFLFVRGDIEVLSRQLEQVYSALGVAVESRGDAVMEHALEKARSIGSELLKAVEALEQKLTLQARMERARI